MESRRLAGLFNKMDVMLSKTSASNVLKPLKHQEMNE